MMDGADMPSPGFSLPACLDGLAAARRWVGWRWEVRKGRPTKPPVKVLGGASSGFARNDRPGDWTTLAEAEQALAKGRLAGIGLQLLGLRGFCAIDLDDVRDTASGALLPWARRLLNDCRAYAEVTPSGTGLRILGCVAPDHPSVHTRKPHPEGGEFEVYANLETGRYITVTGDALDGAPPDLHPIDRAVGRLLGDAGDPHERITGDGDADGKRNEADLGKIIDGLPDWLKTTLQHGGTGDRSADFQRVVNGLHARVSKDAARRIVESHPDGPAAKYKGRLDREFERSWGKAEVSQRGVGSTDVAGDEEIEPSEDGVARALVDRHGRDLRFDHDAGRWFRWRDDHWARDDTRSTVDLVRRVARESSEALEAKKRPPIRRASFVTGAEKLAAADPKVAVTQEVWDADPLLLGLPGGSVDLSTGETLAPERERMISRRAAVAPAEKAECPTWLAFLDQATGGDGAFIAYLQRLFGYALTGQTSEHVLVFIHGPGGNGKSVFLNTLSGVLGDYAEVAPIDAFTASHGDRHPTELAMLRGARLVTASETESGRPWAESRIKQLTGGDPISARFMRQDFFTFRPRFKLVIVGNHKPILRNVDDAARRRFHIVPFVRKPRMPDPALEEKLRTEWPEILRWAIEGSLAWRERGLDPPHAVLAETHAYFGTQDLLGQWLEDCCISDPGNEARWEPAADLFQSWTGWCEANGEKPGSQKTFGDALEQRGFGAGRRKPQGRQVRVRFGLTLQRREAQPHWSETQ